MLEIEYRLIINLTQQIKTQVQNQPLYAIVIITKVKIR